MLYAVNTKILDWYIWALGTGDIHRERMTVRGDFSVSVYFNLISFKVFVFVFFFPLALHKTCTHALCTSHLAYQIDSLMPYAYEYSMWWCSFSKLNFLFMFELFMYVSFFFFPFIDVTQGERRTCWFRLCVCVWVCFNSPHFFPIEVDAFLRSLTLNDYQIWYRN